MSISLDGGSGEVPGGVPCEDVTSQDFPAQPVDLGVVAEQADEVAIMYAGKIVERANTKAIFSHPFHPYTVGLLNSLPGATGQKKKRLDAIPGVVPNPLHLPSGCRFRDRCPRAADLCAQVEPPLEEKEAGHPAACHFPHTETRIA